MSEEQENFIQQESRCLGTDTDLHPCVSVSAGDKLTHPSTADFLQAHVLTCQKDILIFDFNVY